MESMKVSISLAEEEVEFLDAYARSKRMPSRSAVVQRAVRLLRASELAGPYAEAWEEWAAADDAELWASTVADGLPRSR
jgi:Arc/MetJ-type ribon-helix-helix transcriptional regulator